jgi:CheY-like chemotaxis protein
MQEKPKTILVVEDEAGVLELVVGFLSDLGHRVLAAGEGAKALAILDNEPEVDLVFTDLVMPGEISGFTVARRAVALRPGIKILYTTGYADQLQQNEALVARGTLVPKPYRLGRLGVRLKELLETPPEEQNETLRTAYHCWREWRDAPERTPSDAFPIDAVSALSPYLIWVDAVDADGSMTFHYRSIGDRLVEFIGYDLTGEEVGAHTGEQHREFLGQIYRELVETGRPIYTASSYATTRATVATERLFLPLAAAGGRVRRILVAQSFDRMDTPGSIHTLLRVGAMRRDVLRRIALPDALTAER